MSVIELGLVSEQDRPLPPWRPSPRLAAIAVAILCLFTVTGSALPRSQAPVALWNIPLDGGLGDTFAVAGTGVYVLSSPPGARRLTGYDGHTGARRWSHDLARPVSYISAVVAGVIVLPGRSETLTVKQSDGTMFTQTVTRETLGVDTATGRQLWLVPGELTVADDHRALATEWARDGVTARSTRVVDVRDGTTLWTHPGRDLPSWQVGAGRVITATAAGQVESRVLADGRLLASQRLPWILRAGPEGYRAEPSLVGDSLIAEKVDGDRATLIAYDSATLRERWHVDHQPSYGSYSCGLILCVSGEHGITGYDPATGNVLWRRGTPGWATPLSAGALVVDDGTEGARTVIEATTGRPLLDLGKGTWTADETHAYVLRPTTDPVGRTMVGRFDARTGTVVPLGVIDPVEDFGCRTSGRLTGCGTTDSRLSILDLGSAP